MKRVKTIFLVTLGCVVGLYLGVWSYAVGGTMTPNGIFQGDLYNFLSNALTLTNELKADHNTVFPSYSGCAVLANETKADRNLSFVDYSGAKQLANELKSDHNTVMANFSTIKKELETLRLRHNSTYAKMSTLNDRAGKTGGFATVTGTQKLVLGADLRDATAANAVVISGARTTAADATITSTRTTSADASGTSTRTTSSDLTLTPTGP